MVKTQDNFFSQSNCSRCNKELHIRTMSWFKEEAICMECSTKEKELKVALRKKYGHDFEGCGYIPKLEEVKNESI